MAQFWFGVTITAAVIIIINIAVTFSFSFGARNDSETLESRDACVKPGVGPGICKPLTECEPLRNLLKEGKSRPRPWVVDFLKRSQCGFSGKDPIVCCPVRVSPKNPQPNEKKVVKKQPLEKLWSKSCGLVQTVDRLMGGSEAIPHEFPWMALIGYRTKSGLQYRCGGSLISSRYVLTAAHCVINLKDIHPTSVRLGEHDLDTSEDSIKGNGSRSPVKDLPIEDIIPHPEFNKPKFRNDIALIRLGERVQFRDHIRPICLPLEKKSSEIPKDKRPVVAGWGLWETGTTSKVLRKLSLPIIPVGECSKLYRNISITELQICAGGEDGKDSCKGDSGGPLQSIGSNPSGQTAYIQHGVVSFGPSVCGTKGLPGVYTRVVSYIDWIIKSIKE